MAFEYDGPGWMAEGRSTVDDVIFDFRGTVIDNYYGSSISQPSGFNLRFVRDYGSASTSTKINAMTSLARKALLQIYNQLGAAADGTAPGCSYHIANDVMTGVTARLGASVLDTFYSADRYTSVGLSLGFNRSYGSASVSAQNDAMRQFCRKVVGQAYDAI